MSQVKGIGNNCNSHTLSAIHRLHMYIKNDVYEWHNIVEITQAYNVPNYLVLKLLLIISIIDFQLSFCNKSHKLPFGMSFL